MSSRDNHGVYFAYGDNVVGGSSADEGNVIANNSRAGIAVDNRTGSQNNLLRLNAIHSNVEIGIDLKIDGQVPGDRRRRDDQARRADLRVLIERSIE